MEQHLTFMKLALEQARQSYMQDEVPVGAVVVLGSKVIAQAHNQTKTTNNPCAHAEVLALQQASLKLANYRLNECVIYVTLEPCLMCLGAILTARVKQIIYAVPDEKTGACGGVIDLIANNKLNHHSQCLTAAQLNQAGLSWQIECKKLLQDFFQQKRQIAKVNNTWPLPDIALRTNEAVFQAVMTDKYSCYTNELTGLNGLRMHYLDSAKDNKRQNDSLTIVAVHPLKMWSLCFYQLVELANSAQAKLRVLAPDFIGFGKSDKYKKSTDYSVEQQLIILQQWLISQDINKFVFILGQDESNLLFYKLSQYFPYAKMLVMPAPWQQQLENQFSRTKLQDIPYENLGFKRGVQAWQKILLNYTLEQPPTWAEKVLIFPVEMQLNFEQQILKYLGG